MQNQFAMSLRFFSMRCVYGTPLGIQGRGIAQIETSVFGLRIEIELRSGAKKTGTS